MDIGDYITEHHTALTAWGAKIVNDVANTYGQLLKVPAQVRVKEPMSARAKQLRKNYGSPTTQMTDLVGARFVVLTSTDLVPLRAFIEGHASWNAVQARDPDEEIARDPLVFGYQSHHYEIRPKSGATLPGGLVAPPELCCEVQVRTILQHAHAELTHDALYKPSQKVPSEAQRLVARSMALMETTDEMLCRAIEAVRLANEPAQALQKKARDLVTSLGISTPKSILDLIAEAFDDVIDPTSSRGLQQFVDGNAQVIDLIRGRLGLGLFAFPDAALIAYWLTQVAEDELLLRWPLPGSRPDVELVMSDMGLGV